MTRFSVPWLVLAWMAWLAAFVASHIRVRRSRPKGSKPPRRLRTERISDVGLALQFCAIGVALCRNEAAAGRGWWALAAAMLLGTASVALTDWALHHLGPQWRTQAVISEDHHLVLTGPYRWVRHPIYLAMLGMLGMTLLLLTPWEWAVAAAALSLAGTEIRVRVEEKLLQEFFPREMSSYRRTVKAYLPWIR